MTLDHTGMTAMLIAPDPENDDLRPTGRSVSSPRTESGFQPRRVFLQAMAGPEAGQSWECDPGRCLIGSHEASDLQLDDPSIARSHCEIRTEGGEMRIYDLGSGSGTFVDGLRVREAWLKEGSLVRLGDAVLRVGWARPEDEETLPAYTKSRFGSMVASSVALKSAFASLARTAGSEATILLQGETGTGKEEAARSVHAHSARKDGPYVVIDCGALSPTLLESELFGHERGAFTGAVQRRIGAFESARGGTLVLDEVGELPASLQPKLLRALDSRTIRRVGGNAEIPVDFRLIASTHRPLAEEVIRGTFRADLFYRLAVVEVTLPPLRERPEDLPLLVESLLDKLKATPAARQKLLTPTYLAQLRSSAWPGNVRELRNHLQQCVVLGQALPLGRASAMPASGTSTAPDPRLSYAEARKRALAEFERQYSRALLAHHDNNVSQAARAAGVNRVYLHRLLRRHGLRK